MQCQRFFLDSLMTQNFCFFRRSFQSEAGFLFFCRHLPIATWLLIRSSSRTVGERGQSVWQAGKQTLRQTRYIWRWTMMTKWDKKCGGILMFYQRGPAPSNIIKNGRKKRYKKTHKCFQMKQIARVKERENKRECVCDRGGQRERDRKRERVRER